MFEDVDVAVGAPAAGKAQVERWRTYDEDDTLDVERTDTRLTVHYAKVEDSITRLRELVAAEDACCSFANWNIDADHANLRPVVTGTTKHLAALNVR